VGVTATRMPTLRRAEKIDDMTVALFTSEPDSLLPINLTNLFMASPTHWEALRHRNPPPRRRGTPSPPRPRGPGRSGLTRFVPRERAEMTRNDNYWGTKARAERIVLLPIPEAERAHGGAAVRAGGLDRGALAGCHPAAALAADADRQQPAAACVAVAACFLPSSPLSDVRVRRA
jgi:ABC-type transport system substrate-binding protein